MTIMRASPLHFEDLMRHLRRLIPLVLLVAAIPVSGCDRVRDALTPTSPSAVGPPAANAAIHYSAMGASDALGVGSTTPCQPFSACPNGTGYTHLLSRDLRARGHEVTFINLGIPTAVLSPAIQEVARAKGREVPANLIDHELAFLAPGSTLVTIFGGANDVNALGHALKQGAAGADVKGYIDSQVRAFGADFDRLVRGVKSRAPGAFIIVINIPNLAVFPYASSYTLQEKQALQYISVAFTKEANRQAGSGVAVLDLMCDPAIYDSAKVSSDGFHPSDAGYAYLTQRLLPIVSGSTTTPSSSCSQMTQVPPLF